MPAFFFYTGHLEVQQYEVQNNLWKDLRAVSYTHLDVYKRQPKRTMVLKDLVRLILKSAVETGTPFTFNRDHVNRMNPNAHAGMIYCSNLCTEIAQNMKALKLEESRIVEIDGESVVVNESKPGDFVVCNLCLLYTSRCV